MNNNEEKLRKVLGDILQIDADTISEDTSVDNVDKWDSQTHLNLVLALELEFDISFTEEQSVEILSYVLIKIVLGEHGVNF
jgi:acyl carrier protein